MKLFLLPAFSALLLAGCDLPDSSARSEDKGTNDPVGTVANSSSVLTNSPVAPPPQLPPNLPAPAREVINLAHTSVGDSVLTNFIANLAESFHLDADQVVYLRDLGVSPAVIEALLVKEQALAKFVGSVPVTATPPAVEPSSSSQVGPIANAQVGSGIAAAPTVYPGGQPELAPPQVGPAVASSAPPDPNPQEPAPVEINNNYFYDSLSPYGNWFSVPSYGVVWQPSCAVVTPGWRPYWNDGGWVWSDAGWFWNSCYSWGWAPFHYGNWINAPGAGWCWVPGNRWAPSWVTFRFGGGHCGWAPLPPRCGWSSGVGLTWAGSGVAVGFGFSFGAADYCWTPTRCFAVANCSRFGVTGPRVNQLYQNSTVINNYIVGNNNTIINNGIDPARITSESRSEVRKMQLADVNNPSNASGLAAATARPGQTGRLPVYRPSISSSAVTTGGATTARQEARPTQFAGLSSGGTESTRIPARPAVTQPDRMPAQNPPTSAVELHSGGNQSSIGSLPGRSGVASAAGGGTRPAGSFTGAPVRNPSARTSPSLDYTGGRSQTLASRNTMPAIGATATQGNNRFNRLEPRKPQASAYEADGTVSSGRVASGTRPNGLPGNPSRGIGSGGQPNTAFRQSVPTRNTPQTVSPSANFRAPAPNRMTSTPAAMSGPRSVPSSRPSFNSAPARGGGSSAGGSLPRSGRPSP